MKQVGDTIVLSEGVDVVDSLGANFLPRGTEGVITEINGALFSMNSGGEICRGIPLVSARLKDESEEAAA